MADSTVGPAIDMKGDDCHRKVIANRSALQAARPT
jgi:hypothetical protein